ncbi:hypothetical protein Droror1_Dr00011630 [Drosera rotundifolia]
MIENIDKVLDRGERLELLVDKTATLQGNTLRFRRQACRFRSTVWRRNCKLMYVSDSQRMFSFISTNVFLHIYLSKRLDVDSQYGPYDCVSSRLRFKEPNSTPTHARFILSLSPSRFLLLLLSLSPSLSVADLSAAQLYPPLRFLFLSPPPPPRTLFSHISPTPSATTRKTCIPMTQIFTPILLLYAPIRHHTRLRSKYLLGKHCLPSNLIIHFNLAYVKDDIGDKSVNEETEQADE